MEKGCNLKESEGKGWGQKRTGEKGSESNLMKGSSLKEGGKGFLTESKLGLVPV
jgi:hypothetical protein